MEDRRGARLEVTRNFWEAPLPALKMRHSSCERCVLVVLAHHVVFCTVNSSVPGSLLIVMKKWPSCGAQAPDAPWTGAPRVINAGLPSQMSA